MKGAEVLVLLLEKPCLMGEVFVEVNISGDHKGTCCHIQKLPSFHSGLKASINGPLGLGGQLSVLPPWHQIFTHAAKNFEHAQMWWHTHSFGVWCF